MIIQVAYRQDLKFNHELTSPKNRDRVQITPLEKRHLNISLHRKIFKHHKLKHILCFHKTFKRFS